MARRRITPERASRPASRTIAIRRRPERRCRRFIASEPASGACGPCGDVLSAPGAHRASTCGYETRASCAGISSWVGTSA
jgi:hypothetical protein